MNSEEVCPYCLSTEILLSYQFCYCKDCGEETIEPLLLEETNEEERTETCETTKIKEDETS